VIIRKSHLLLMSSVQNQKNRNTLALQKYGYTIIECIVSLTLPNTSLLFGFPAFAHLFTPFLPLLDNFKEEQGIWQL
jgi:hypothetical protein